jgi:vanillate O-demethylase ferredoxin subunit
MEVSMNEQSLKVRVLKREMQGRDILVLDLQASDTTPLPAFEAGSHVDVHLDGGLIRQYSLCGNPGQTSIYRIGVLKDPASRGGSIAVHEQMEEGRELCISPPRNLFALSAEAEYSILIGGGIGITPMIAMAYELQTRGAPFELHYCGRLEAHSAFVEELSIAPFADRVHKHFGEGRLRDRWDAGAALGQGKAGTHVYICGPTGFMEWIIDSALVQGFAQENIHREFFQTEVDTSGAGFEVVAARTGKTLNVGAGQSIVAALAEVGIEIEMSCEQGICGTCVCDVLEGEPDHRDVYLTDEEKSANDQMLLCCSRARSKRLVLDV